MDSIIAEQGKTLLQTLARLHRDVEINSGHEGKLLNVCSKWRNQILASLEVTELQAEAFQLLLKHKPALYRQIEHDEGWTRLWQAAKSAENAKSGKNIPSKEMWRRLRALARLTAVWGKEIVDYYQFPTWNREKLEKLSDIAAHASFTQFALVANCIMLDRHEASVTNNKKSHIGAHSNSLSTKFQDSVSPRRPLQRLDLIKAHSFLVKGQIITLFGTDGSGRKPPQFWLSRLEQWIRDNHGDVKVANMQLKLHAQDLNEYLVGYDEFGMLVQRMYCKKRQRDELETETEDGEDTNDEHAEQPVTSSSAKKARLQTGAQYKLPHVEEVPPTPRPSPPPPPTPERSASHPAESTADSSGNPDVNSLFVGSASAERGTDRSELHIGDDREGDDGSDSNEQDDGRDSDVNATDDSSSKQTTSNAASPHQQSDVGERGQEEQDVGVEENVNCEAGALLASTAESLHNSAPAAPVQEPPHMTHLPPLVQAWLKLPLVDQLNPKPQDLVEYLTPADVSTRLNNGEVFQKAIVVEYPFLDSDMFDPGSFVRTLRNFYGKQKIQVRCADRGLDMLKVLDLANRIERPEESHGYNALDIRNITGDDEPLFTRHERYRLLHALVERSRLNPAPGKPIHREPYDVAGCLRFNGLGFEGAFSGPHMDSLVGTYVRILFGKKRWMIIDNRLLTDEERQSFVDNGPSWPPPPGKGQQITLKRNQTLLMPPGLLVIHAVYTEELSLMSGGMIWDYMNIEKILEGLLSVGSNQTTTNEPIAQQLPNILAELEAWAAEEPLRFSTDQDTSNFINVLRQLIQRLRSLSCNCASRCQLSSNCKCKKARRRCTTWCHDSSKACLHEEARWHG